MGGPAKGITLVAASSSETESGNEVEVKVAAASTSTKRPAKDEGDEEKGRDEKKLKTKNGAVGAARIQTTLSFGSKASKSAPPEEPDTPLPEIELPSQVPIADLEMKTMGIDWRTVLEPEFKKSYFIELKKFIQEEYNTKTIFPVARDVYSWSRLTKLDKVKIVIIGQDPYHGPKQAHGLSFSVRDPVPPPPSLVNIYKQLASDFPEFKIPKSGDLSATARQGVLWLNTSLTVRSGQAASHSKKGWETFTTAVLKAVVNRRGARGVVFLAWGAHAQKVCQTVGIDGKKHLVLKSAHPSPLSAHKGFLGNEHFKKANEWLIKTQGKDAAINWAVLNPKEVAAEEEPASEP